MLNKSKGFIRSIEWENRKLKYFKYIYIWKIKKHETSMINLKHTTCSD